MQTSTDAAFIDDECMVTMAPSPARLRKGIDTMLRAFATVFSNFGLHINWKPGKTEGIVRFRGR
eukprot:1045907-Pyramimonas_sp.AAC.1